MFNNWFFKIKTLIVAFANFHSVNILLIVSFKLPRWCSWIQSWKKICTISFHKWIRAGPSTPLRGLSYSLLLCLPRYIFYIYSSRFLTFSLGVINLLVDANLEFYISIKKLSTLGLCWMVFKCAGFLLLFSRLYYIYFNSLYMYMLYVTDMYVCKILFFV